MSNIPESTNATPAGQEVERLREVLTDFAVEAIEAWKRNSESEIDSAINRAVGKVQGL